MAHVPVLVEEVIKFLDPRSNENFVDCTLGDGGHAAEILRRTAPKGKVLGFDLDPQAIKVAAENLKAFGDRLVAVNASYVELGAAIKREKFGPVAGVLADFGFSSPQLEERGRGFSFQRDEPLDMSYGTEAGHLTAADIVNTWSKDEIVHVLAEYGEERMAGRIAAAIIKARRDQHIIGTRQLVEVIKSAVPKSYEHGRIDPATRTFQALRIAVNNELGSIETLLPRAAAAIEPGGRLVCISFHSLEDRIVKNFMKEAAASGRLEILTKKPVIASVSEIENNPRARSAKLRAAQKCGDT